MMTMTENDYGSTRAAAKRSERTCAGCGKTAPPEELVRVLLDPASGAIAVDLTGRPGDTALGRGAHLHAAPDCVAKSLKGGLSRAFKTKVVADAAAIGADIVTAADRRIDGLLTGARRAGQLAVGADAVVEALQAGRAELVVVARDARAATRLPEIERAVAAGKAIALHDKQTLGRLAGRAGESEVAVAAVLHQGVADAVARAYRMAGPFRTSGTGEALAVEVAKSAPSDAHVESTGRSEEAWSSSPEVR